MEEVMEIYIYIYIYIYTTELWTLNVMGFTQSSDGNVSFTSCFIYNSDRNVNFIYMIKKCKQKNQIWV